VKPLLPYHLAFHIDVVYTKHVIKRTIIDEGESSYVMSLSYWKDIDSPKLAPSPTLLIAFDGQYFRSHGFISSFSIHLGGKSDSVEVEVFNTSLDYNMLLGRRCTYTMTTIISSIFKISCFPHEERIVTINQMAFNHFISTTNLGYMVP